MKICFLCGDLSRGGGTEKITQIIVDELSKIEKLTIFVADVVNSSNSIFFPMNDRVCVEHLCQGNMYKTIKKLYKFLKKNSIDIIVNVDIMLIIYSYIPSRLNKTAIISWEQFNYFNDIGSKHTQYIRQFCLKYTDYYINLTKADMVTFQKNFKIKIPITYIYNPVMNKGEVSGKYEVRSKQLITAGNFYKSKGYQYCIEVGNIVFSKHSDWKWIFCGDGNEFENIQKLANETNWKNNFIFTGRVSNLNRYMEKASIYVSCSLSEGFGLVLIEAQQSRLPIVAFDVPFGPSEIICDDINGFLIDNQDVEEMAKRIIYLIEHEEKRVLFSQNSSILHEKFSLDKILKEWVTVLNQVYRKRDR